MQDLCVLILFCMGFHCCLAGHHGSSYSGDGSQNQVKIYHAFFAKATWWQSRMRCKQYSLKIDGLARFTQKSTLTFLKSWLYNGHSNQKIYWVGIRYNNTMAKFLWDDDNEIVNASQTLKGIVDITDVVSSPENSCLAITKDHHTLQPFRCTSRLRFICESTTAHPSVSSITPSTSGSSTEPPSTTERSTKSPSTTGYYTEASSTTERSTESPRKTSKTKPTQPRRTTQGKVTHQRPTTRENKRPSQPTVRPHTDTDKKVDDYINKIEEIDVTDFGSINEVLNETTSLMKDIKSNKDEKGNVMKATLQMEKFGMEYIKLHYINSSYHKMTNVYDDFVFELRKVSSKQKIAFPDKRYQNKDKDHHTNIDLPGSLFGGETYLVNTLLIDVSDNIIAKAENSNILHEIVSPVISSTLDPKPQDVLKDNVTIVLEHFKKPTKFKPRCVYWEFNNKTGSDGEWSDSGCITRQTSEDQTICSCNHLTSFALLMQVDDTSPISEQHKLALSYITYIGCALSLLGEVLTLLAYVFLMNMKQEQCQIRVNLAISLAVAQIFFLSGITATSNLGVCTFVAVMLHFFYLVAFGWMMLEGVYLYLMVVKVFNTVIKMKLYYIFAWGFPLLVVAISLIVSSTFKDGINSYTHQDFCWVSFSNGLIWTFAAPVLLITLVNVIILACVVREMTRLNRTKTTDMDTFRRGVKACVVLFPLLGLTWLFGLLSVTDAGIVFQYIFTILNSFQGLLIFLLHCLRSGEIRSSFQRKVQRWKLTQSTNFGSSKDSQAENTASTFDKNTLKFASSESLQDSLSRSNRINALMLEDIDEKSVQTCVTPIDGPYLSQNCI